MVKARGEGTGIFKARGKGTDMVKACEEGILAWLRLVERVLV